MTSSANNRPRVTLKLATSLDGRIATRTGNSQWITGPQSRRRVHEMRASHDCVLTGIGTVLADDPELTARLDPPVLRQPLRVVLDSKRRMPAITRLSTTANLGPVCVFHALEHPKAPVEAGIERVYVKGNQNGEGLDLEQVLAALQSQFQIQSVMVEAGGQLAGSFLRAGLVDTLVWFRAPIMIGGDGLSVTASLGIDALSDALAFECVSLVPVGTDVMETYHIRQAM